MNPLQNAIAGLMTLVETVVDETTHQYDFVDLTHQQLHYLKVIIRMNNPTITELAKELKLTKPSITALVDKLVEKGYVAKVQSDEDRRFQHLHIAEKGLQINRLFNLSAEHMTEVIQNSLTETEAEIFHAILNKIIRNYEPSIRYTP